MMPRSVPPFVPSTVIVAVGWLFTRVVSKVMELTVIPDFSAWAMISDGDVVSRVVAPVVLSCSTRLPDGATATLSRVFMAMGVPGSIIVTNAFVGEVERVSVLFSGVPVTES